MDFWEMKMLGTVRWLVSSSSASWMALPSPALHELVAGLGWLVPMAQSASVMESNETH